MGMFDSFEPVPELACSVCGARLTGWQGKDGPCALLRWRQGVASPVDQDVPDESKGDRGVIDSLRLPREFEIYTPCCEDRFLATAICTAPEGVWSTTVLETAANTRQRRHERHADFKARLAWLRRGAVPGSHRG
jgi:hypothetical protein